MLESTKKGAVLMAVQEEKEQRTGSINEKASRRAPLTEKVPRHSALTTQELDWVYSGLIESKKIIEFRIKPSYNLIKRTIEVPCPNPYRCIAAHLGKTA